VLQRVKQPDKAKAAYVKLARLREGRFRKLPIKSKAAIAAIDKQQQQKPPAKKSTSSTTTTKN